MSAVPQGDFPSRASAAQVRANQQNAKRSTGPRTAIGKSSSSANSVKHGLYSAKCEAVVVGPNPEDPEEVVTFKQAITNALEPRDVLEEAVASEIVLIYLKQRRLAAWESNLIAGVDAMELYEEFVAVDLVGEVAHDEVYNWNLGRTVGTEIGSGLDVSWQKMAEFMQLSLKGQSGARISWVGEVAPVTSDEWRQAFLRLIEERFPSPEALGVWLDERGAEMRRQAHRRQSKAACRVAYQSIDVVERSTVLRARFTSELFKQMALYQMYKARDLGLE